jgi:uncharacterized protein (TIGR02145 family)
MKTLYLLLILFFVFTCLGNAQTIKIGTQVWVTKNLDVTKFRNGDPIPEAKTDEEWEKAGQKKQPAWCFYENDPANGAKYGKLYNWYAVTDKRNICPTGWHVPSNAEWTQLTDYLGGGLVAGGKMKSMGTQYWESPNDDATNSSGWSGLPGGSRGARGPFDAVGGHGWWWTSTGLNTYDAWARGLARALSIVDGGYTHKALGLSVRCIRD